VNDTTQGENFNPKLHLKSSHIIIKSSS